MAQLSSHPSILTVYQASVSSDGRPYLVMELCSSALSQRYRSEQLPVPEVLRIAVKIGSAIETAHRAGVLHRDIKPSNILLTAYGAPRALRLRHRGDPQRVGREGGGRPLRSRGRRRRCCWTRPPARSSRRCGRSARPIYSLLAGRSPFEIPGQSNKSDRPRSPASTAATRSRSGRPDVPAVARAGAAPHDEPAVRTSASRASSR